MEVKVKTFQQLSTEELYEIYRVRVAVFVVEQNCPYQEVDEMDLLSTHVFLEDESNHIHAYLRYFPKPEEPGVIQIGRVLSVEHNQGYGKQVFQQALQSIQQLSSIKELYLEAQTHAKSFYEFFGFECTSDEFLEDDIPHIQMRKKLES